MADLPRLGILLMLAAWLLFSWVDTGAKWLAMAGFSAFQLAFAIKNAAKDVGYYARMAEEAGVDSLMSKGPLAALNEARDAGQADDMVSQMVDFYVQRFQS